MTSPAPLTEAERAAAEALALWHNAHSSTSRLAVAAFEGEARAVVAAVREHLLAEFTTAAVTEFNRLNHEAAKNQNWEAARATKYGADVVKSLSLPASKETPDAR